MRGRARPSQTQSRRTRLSLVRRTRWAIALAITAGAFLTPTAHAEVPFGVGDDGAVIADPSRLDEARDQLDATWVRFMVRKGREHQYEQVIRHADAAGYRILVTLTGAHPSQYPGWAEWIAKHWPTVDAWSVDNEPELRKVPVCQYMRTYERTRRALRTATGAPVLFGELSPHAWRWVELMRFCRPLRTRPDGVAVHTWSGDDPMSPKVGKPWSARPKSYRDPVSGEPWTKRSHRTWISMARIPGLRRLLRRAQLNAPIWITEHGWFRSTPAAQVAAWWPRALVMADRLGARVLIAHGTWSTGRHRAWDSSLPPETHRALTARAATGPRRVLDLASEPRLRHLIGMLTRPQPSGQPPHIDISVCGALRIEQGPLENKNAGAEAISCMDNNGVGLIRLPDTWRDLDAVTACKTLAHELNHVRDIPHHGDRNHLMYGREDGNSDPPYPPCDRLRAADSRLADIQFDLNQAREDRRTARVWAARAHVATARTRLTRRIRRLTAKRRPFLAVLGPWAPEAT